MRLERIQKYLKQKGWDYAYGEENGCGSIDFWHKGLSYHIWESPPEEPGCESNVRSVGRQEEFEGDYEQQILDILKTW